jgi:hypothetical protein
MRLAQVGLEKQKSNTLNWHRCAAHTKLMFAKNENFIYKDKITDHF